MKIENIEIALQDIAILKELRKKHAEITCLKDDVAGSILQNIEITIDGHTVSVNNLGLLELLQISANEMVSSINSIQDTLESL